jgi:hypothetical protein
MFVLFGRIQSEHLNMKQNKKKSYTPPSKPLRDPDHISKRGVYYWWSTEWLRGTNSANTSFGRIKAIKERGTVNLYMVSKDGNLTYIQGSIQQEFKDWHLQRKIDYFFLADDPEALDDIILASDP